MNFSMLKLGFRKRILTGGLTFALAIISFCLIADYGIASAMEKQGSTRQPNPWLTEHLLSEQSEPPFSFVYDRQGSSALLKAWPRKIETRQLDAGRTEYIVRWTDPKRSEERRVGKECVP